MTPKQIKALSSGMCHECSGLLIEQHDKSGNDILRCIGKCKGFINAEDVSVLVRSLDTSYQRDDVEANQRNLNLMR